jgi:uncharacterized membrane protein YkvA (DUF1232 family)
MNEEKAVNGKVIDFTQDKKKMKFYEKLRGKIRKAVSGKVNEKNQKLVEYLLFLPDFFVLLCRLAVDKRVTKKQKLFVGGIITYVILPIDLIPDFIPIIGYADDLVLVVYGLNMILNELDVEVLHDNWSGEEDVLEVLQKITLKAEMFLSKNVVQKVKALLRKMKR